MSSSFNTCHFKNYLKMTKNKTTFHSKSSAFLSECTEDNDCTEPNKGVCENDQCQCNPGFILDGSHCVGTKYF